jgi:hypothetical protein
LKSSKIQWKKRRRRRGRRRLLKSLDVVPAATENTSQAGPTQPVAHVPIGTEVLLAIDIFQGDAAGEQLVKAQCALDSGGQPAWKVLQPLGGQWKNSNVEAAYGQSHLNFDTPGYRVLASDEAAAVHSHTLAAVHQQPTNTDVLTGHLPSNTDLLAENLPVDTDAMAENLVTDTEVLTENQPTTTDLVTPESQAAVDERAPYSLSTVLRAGTTEHPSVHLGRAVNQCIASDVKTWSKGLGNQSSAIGYQLEMMHSSIGFIPESNAPSFLPKVQIRAIAQGASDPRTFISMSNFNLVNFQGSQALPVVKAFLGTLLGQRRVFDPLGADYRGLQCGGGRFTGGVAAGTLRYLHNGTLIFVVATLVVENSTALPFTYLVLGTTQEGAPSPLLVPHTSVMPLDWENERELPPSIPMGRLSHDDEVNQMNMALLMAASGEKTDENCFQCSSDDALWFGRQNHQFFSPTWKAGRPPANKKAAVEKEASQVATENNPKTLATAPSSVSKKRNAVAQPATNPPKRPAASKGAPKQPRVTRNESEPTTRASEPPQSRTTAAAPLVNTYPQEVSAQAQHDAAYYKGLSEAQAALAATFEAKLKKQEDVAAQYEARLMAQESAASEASKAHYEARLKAQEIELKDHKDLTKFSMEHFDKQAERTLNFSLLQGGDGRLPVDGRSASSDDALLSFLKKANFEKYYQPLMDNDVTTPEMFSFVEYNAVRSWGIGMPEHVFNYLKKLAPKL